jgi:hypothetical protein
MYNSLKNDGIRRDGCFLPEKRLIHNKLVVLSTQQIVMEIAVGAIKLGANWTNPTTEH